MLGIAFREKALEISLVMGKETLNIFQGNSHGNESYSNRRIVHFCMLTLTLPVCISYRIHKKAAINMIESYQKCLQFPFPFLLRIYFCVTVLHRLYCTFLFGLIRSNVCKSGVLAHVFYPFRTIIVLHAIKNSHSWRRFSNDIRH